MTVTTISTYIRRYSASYTWEDKERSVSNDDMHLLLGITSPILQLNLAASDGFEESEAKPLLLCFMGIRGLL